MSDPRPFEDLSSSGLLWLINATCFHSRGFALSLHVTKDGKATGWSLMGDGTEPWYFEGARDAKFEAVAETFRLSAALAEAADDRPDPTDLNVGA